MLKKKTEKKKVTRVPKKKQELDYYTTVGFTRGRCGHKHKTLMLASMCLASDAEYCTQKSTKGVHAYSDRHVIGVKGNKDVRLSTEEMNKLRSDRYDYE